ncbi:HPr-rel-A system PqqD family peptide chaperone [Marichromatium bheemlicum]|uniref:HPr-rel-A system PqqD family peptide chaperone n=1 Tax=Marichromatium bheemlicum TaxID=365339 RepID=A0ABX1IAI3_9GAMM|nr:HPr-rel-A system PqqD family peptide chaperone [Marichromatium bheemlicum]NKN33370.1 HPr-rel-A system PqqD family peptide chaperone [Marichromatium bheemlicum]
MVRPVRWRLSSAPLLEVVWDGERLLYQGASGETHYLNAAGSQVVARLHEGEATVDDLLAVLDPAPSAGAAEVLRRSQLEALLARLDELGIVIGTTTA